MGPKLVRGGAVLSIPANAGMSCAADAPTSAIAKNTVAIAQLLFGLDSSLFGPQLAKNSVANMNTNEVIDVPLAFPTLIANLQ